jgi:NADPH:quinone reductase-like Zn-dependent oxidoreductase
MRILYKITKALALLIALALLALFLTVSYDAPCQSPPTVAHSTGDMKAISYFCYGSPDILVFGDIAKPVAADDEVLIKIHTAAINPLDWHYMRGSPSLMRLMSGIGKPTHTRLGVDFAGTIEAVGKNVSKYKPGDQVFGGKNGAYAQYIAMGEDRALALKPANVTFEQAAAMPIAAITALQALRDEGKLQAGQSVLINGASGGVGTYAVQLAKIMGGEVTGVCSARNESMVRALGADYVIDYTRENFTESDKRYDLIIDMVGNHGLLTYRQTLKPGGRLIMIGGPSEGFFTPVISPLKSLLISPFVSQEFVPFIAQLNKDDLAILAEYMRTGQLTSVIDKSYPLADAAAAVRYSEDGHARGKILLSMD